MLKTIVNKIKRISIIWKSAITFCCILLTSTSVFLAGSMKPESYIEKTAACLTEIVKNDPTKNGFLPLQIIPNDKESENSMPRVFDEYYYWKYIFRHSDFSFLATVNGGKTHQCYYSEIQFDKNVSFIYCANNLNPKKGDFYKHEVYDIDLMFEGETRILEGTLSFITISQTIANKLLCKRLNCAEGTTFSVDDYRSLISTKMPLLMDGSEYLFTISNIYFEEGTFFKNTKTVIDEFVLSYTIFPENFKKECTYIFNSYTYQNYHKLIRIKEMVNTRNFSLSSKDAIPCFDM